MRTLLCSKPPKRLGKSRNRWVVRIPHGAEKKSIEGFLGYVGNEPFWFDGGKDGKVYVPVFVGHGDGHRVQFFLPDRYVFAPTLVVRVNDWVESNWELDEHRGLLTFMTAPSQGCRITATYHCKFQCIALRKKNGTIEIRQVDPLRSNRYGQSGGSKAARRIIADFLNFQVGTELERESPLHWLFYESKDFVEIGHLQSDLLKVLEPVVDPKPTHDTRASRYLRSLPVGEVLNRCPQTSLRLDLERLVQLALLDRKFQRIRRCQYCKRFFVAPHAHTRVCSPDCAVKRERRQHALRQARYNRKQKLQRNESQRIKAEQEEVALFERFIKKASGDVKAQLEVGLVLKKIPGTWKTIDRWNEQLRVGMSYDNLWRSLPTTLRATLHRLLMETLDVRVARG